MNNFTIFLFTILVLSVGINQNVFAHNPDFEVRTAEDILKFCEFFYEEYQMLGIDNLVDQHPNFPNLRGCAILYNHVAWGSTHEARDLVLIAEIEKYLGDANYMKDKHLEFSSIMPDWVKREAQLWVNNEKTDSAFAFGIRAMLEAGVLDLNSNVRDCKKDTLCFREGDFIKYSHFDKYDNVVTSKHTVLEVNENEIILNIQEISEGGISNEEITINEKGLITSTECCNYYEYLVPTGLSLNDMLHNDVKIVSETNYMIDQISKQSWLASDSTGQNKKIIDKDTGLVFSHNVHETEVLTVGDETKITETNFFDAKYDMTVYETKIPEWWKDATTWLLEAKISEDEYLRAMENLISRNILRV